VKCALPDAPVVCFTGDGGFYYHLAELETARRYNIPATIVINNNSGFGQNLTGVHRIAGNRPGLGEELIRFGPTDFTAVAKSFGVRGIRVEQPQDLAPALQQALAADAPVVVDVVTDLEPRAPEAWAPPTQR
jgi:acetolactate synthase-1/2/3 large subunit